MDMTLKGGKLWKAILAMMVMTPLLAMKARAVDENRRVGWAAEATFGWEADGRYLVRFTTTTVAANTTVCLVSTHTAGNFVVPSSATFAPVVLSSTTNTLGGRAFMTFQVVAATANVSVDFDTVNLSTTTSPYLTAGQWFSPDDPIAWQGQVCLKSPAVFTVTGWYWDLRPR